MFHSFAWARTNRSACSEFEILEVKDANELPMLDGAPLATLAAQVGDEKQAKVAEHYDEYKWTGRVHDALRSAERKDPLIPQPKGKNK